MHRLMVWVARDRQLRGPVHLKSAVATYGRTYGRRVEDLASYEGVDLIHINKSAD